MPDNFNIKLSDEDINTVLAAYKEFSNYSKAAESVVINLVKQRISEIGAGVVAAEGLPEVTRSILRQYPDKYDLERLVQQPVNTKPISVGGYGKPEDENIEATHNKSDKDTDIISPEDLEKLKHQEGAPPVVALGEVENYGKPPTVPIEKREFFHEPGKEPIPTDKVDEYIKIVAGTDAEMSEFIHQLVCSAKETFPTDYVVREEGEITYFNAKKIIILIDGAKSNYGLSKERSIKLIPRIGDFIETGNLQDALVGKFIEKKYVATPKRIENALSELKEFEGSIVSSNLLEDIVHRTIKDEIRDYEKMKKKVQDKAYSALKEVPGGTSSEDSKEPPIKVIEDSSKPQSSIPTTQLESSDTSKKGERKTSIFTYLFGFTSLALTVIALYSSQIANRAVEEIKKISKDSIAAMETYNGKITDLTKTFVPIEAQQKINDAQNTAIGNIDSKVNTFQKDVNGLSEKVTITEQNINDKNKKLEDRIANYEGINAKILEIDGILTEMQKVSSSNKGIIEENRIEYNKLLLSFKALTERIVREKADYDAQKDELEWVKATLEDLSYQLKEQQPKVVKEEVKSPEQVTEEKKEAPQDTPKPTSKPTVSKELMEKLKKFRNK